MMGEALASAPPLPSPLSPFRRPRRCSRRTTRVRAHWRRTVQRHRRPAALTHSRTCRRPRSGPERGGWGSDAPCRSCVTRTGPPRASHGGGHRGMRHCCSRHHKGHPRLVPAAGGARQRKLFGLGGQCAPSPPGGGGSDDDNGEGALQGSGAALAPTGCSGSLRCGHGRAEGADTLPRAPSPSVALRHQGWVGGGGGAGAARP